MKTDDSNQHFQLAAQFVLNTNQPIFLTGKAGTGKTTFLKYIKDKCHKKLAITAPTGVAAINAGGTTLHSFFQLPFGPFIPTRQQTSINLNMGVNNQLSILQNMRLNKTRRQVLQELELLIIDEVSMVRADLIDAIDTILRHFRQEPNKPFGGVQLLFIGDLFQLPPVIASSEWELLSPYYNSAFFFEAQVLKQSPPLYLELKKIYRQSDDAFISVLNNIRNNTAQEADLKLLNSYYHPDFKPESQGEYITLTTHNSKADKINKSELSDLIGSTRTFEASIVGDFNERAHPVEKTLELKQGAQIMFTKNDKGENRRFFNGKIGTIKRIEMDKIIIGFPNTKEELILEKETWKNINYNYNKEADKIEEEELGSFTQYPIRLAWAITIHKSQGLTFEKAIIDAGHSFAPGQVYVALSRLTSLDGLKLYSKIDHSSISTDKKVLAFTQSEQNSQELEQLLVQKQQDYLSHTLLQTFNWNKLTDSFNEFSEGFKERQIPLQNEAIELTNTLIEKIKEQQKIATAFIGQLNALLSKVSSDGYKPVHERVEAAYNYFTNSINETSIKPLEEHYETIRTKAKTKKYTKEVQSLLLLLKQKIVELEQALKTAKGLAQGKNIGSLLEEIEVDKSKELTHLSEEKESKTGKTPKGESHRISLALFKQGKSIPEIAKERDYAQGTIEGHLASFIETGEIDITELISEEKIIEISKVLDTNDEITSKAIKDMLGEDYSYGDIKAVMSYRKKTNSI